MPQTRRTLLKLFTTGAVVVAAGHRPTVGRDTEGGARVIPVPEPRIARFEELAYGMFVHWGVFSLMGQCVWAMHPGRFPLEDYKRQVPRFTAKEFNPRAWAATARRSGMRYMTLTARQHDGFSLYDTRGLSDYDAVHVGPGRDLVAEFVEGCRAEGIEPFLYHTTYDWYQPSFTQDFDAYLEYLHKSIEVLCTYYGKLGGFWFDGNWSKRPGRRRSISTGPRGASPNWAAARACSIRSGTSARWRSAPLPGNAAIAGAWGSLRKPSARSRDTWRAT